jgi:multiple sugar transport system permease protein
MTVGLLFLLKASALWAGILSVVRSLWICFSKTLTALGWAALGVLLLGLSSLLPGLSQEAAGLVRLPLVLPLMPTEFLLVFLFGVLALNRILAAITALSMSERSKALRWASLWGALGFWLGWIGIHSSTKFQLKGGVLALSTTQLVLLLAVGICVMLSIAFVLRKAEASAKAKNLATHLGLIAGSIIFGLPLAWMLATSFREDGEISSGNGIRWIPMVQVKEPYKDRNLPYFSAVVNGQSIEGVPLSTHANGNIVLEIRRPLSLIGQAANLPSNALTEIPEPKPEVLVQTPSGARQGLDLETLPDGRHRVHMLQQSGSDLVVEAGRLAPVTRPGIRWQNYSEALEFLPPETVYGLVYVRNTLIIVLLSVIGAVFSSAIVAYAFARLKFPGNKFLFSVLLSTMMLPAAVTLMPQFMIFRELGWIDTLKPLWVPAFFASAFNVFMLRQFFAGVPIELEEAAKLDGCSVPRTFWSVTLPQIKPALATIAIWTAVASWNNFTGPLIYISSPKNMPIAYAVQLFQGVRNDEPALLMAFVTLSVIPVVLLFLFAQRYFLQSAAASGLGGR